MVSIAFMVGMDVGNVMVQDGQLDWLIFWTFPCGIVTCFCSFTVVWSLVKTQLNPGFSQMIAA